MNHEWGQSPNGELTISRVKPRSLIPTSLFELRRDEIRLRSASFDPTRRPDKEGAVRGMRGISIWLDLTGAFPKWKVPARKHPLNVTSGWGEKIIILQYIQAIVIVILIDHKQNGENILFV